MTDAWTPPVAVLERPRQVEAAGIIQITLGILGCLAGAIVAALGVFLQVAPGDMAGLLGIPGMTEIPIAFLAGVLYFLAGLLAIWGVAGVVAGIGIFRRRGWGRVLGIVLSVIGLFAAAGIADISLVPTPEFPEPDYGLAVVGLVILVVNVACIWFLGRNGTWFATAPSGPAPRA